MYLRIPLRLSWRGGTNAIPINYPSFILRGARILGVASRQCGAEEPAREEMGVKRTESEFVKLEGVNGMR